MKRLTILIVAIVTFYTQSSSASIVGYGGGGVVWSLNCDGYLVSVPKGWALDNKFAAASGIDMFFCRKT